MALSDDQRALLRLLAKREEGYEDIAALKGLSVEQVRAEVSDALAELQAAGQAPPPLPPEPPEVEEPPEPPRAPEEKPDPGPASPPSVEPKAQAKPAAARPTRPVGLPAERRRLVLLTGGALGIVAIVLIAVAVFSDGSGSDSSSAASSGSGSEIAATENSKVTQAVLEPADGGDARGSAVFGKLGREEIVLQVTAEGLEPTSKGQSYTVWLYRTPKLSLRVGSVPVGESGRLGARFTIPAELLAYVASGAFNQIYVSRTSNAAYRQEVAQARKSKSLPQYTGETVLSGEITGPIAKQGRSR